MCKKIFRNVLSLLQQNVSGLIHQEANHATVSLDRIMEPFTADVTVASRRLLEEQKKQTNKQ